MKTKRKYTVTPKVIAQRSQAGLRSGEIRADKRRDWVGTQVSRGNRDYARLTFGSVDNAISHLRKLAAQTETVLNAKK